MKKSQRKQLIIVTLGILLSTLGACRKNPEQTPEQMLLGKWNCENVITLPDGLPNNMEFLNDGSGIISRPQKSVKWSDENKKLKLIVDNHWIYLYSYEVNGNVLIIKDDAGNKVNYIRQ